MRYTVEMASDGMIIRTKFNEDWFRHAGHIKAYLDNSKSCSVGAINKRDF
jgi:hypothetical protein